MPAAPVDHLEHLGDALAFTRETPKRRMLVIVNPYASTVSDRLKTLVTYALQGRYEVDAIETEAKGHAIELCREAGHEGYDVVVAFGGDGTANEAANGLKGSGTPLTVLPGGRTNVLCKMLGIPGDVVDATEHLLRLADTWTPRTIDVARVNERWFTFSAGLGLDASVVARVDEQPTLKRRLGAWYFTTSAITTFTTRYVVHPPRLVVKAGGREVPGVTAIVQNGDPFTYFNDRPIHVGEGATLDSGDLSTTVLQRATPLDVPGVLQRALSKRRRVWDHRRIAGLPPSTAVTVRSADDRPIPLQVDGDYIGDVHEAVFTIAPGALDVVA
jgi:diacylglycerol kinase family enzyme